ncbi:MAG TPA: hypothetical protein PLJ44_02590, partial [Victivallales bacterium]|nr:hypothetical protein [Victivallales bacterium]
MKKVKIVSNIFLFFVFLVFSCRNSEISKKILIPSNYSEVLSFRGMILYGGNGSITEPIIIKGAKSTFYGIEAEQYYLEKYYPGYILS